jgi:hypothetical protein
MNKFGCKQTNNSDELYKLVSYYFDKALSTISLSIIQNGVIGTSTYVGALTFIPIVSNTDYLTVKTTESMSSSKNNQNIKTDLISWK